MMAVIAGDFNVATSRSQCLQNCLDETELVDLGVIAQVWGGRPNQPTCRVNAGAKETRMPVATFKSDDEALMALLKRIKE